MDQALEQPVVISEKTGKPKRKKTGGRVKGSKNKRPNMSLAKAKKELAEAMAGRRKLAIDHMDDLIEYLRNLVGLLSPWAPDGSSNGKDMALWFQALEALRGFLHMRAPYQSPRLSAIAFVPDRMKELNAEARAEARSLLLDDLRARGIVIEHGLFISERDKVLDITPSRS